MKNKKGFTLIEMLSVVVILSIIFLFVSPKLVELIKEGEETSKLITDVRILDAINEYSLENNVYENLKKEGDTYSISASELINSKYIDEDEIDIDSIIIIKLESDDNISYFIDSSEQ